LGNAERREKAGWFVTLELVSHGSGVTISISLKLSLVLDAIESAEEQALS
jgi:hypothetical protein